MTRSANKAAWMLRKAYLWGRSSLGLRRGDVILAFHPKTGSTWVRIFFYHLLTKASAQAEFSFDQIDRVMPEFANPSFFHAWSFPGVPRLIKTHRPYTPLFRGKRAVLFAREPRDTMISFLHYANAKKEFGFSGSLHDLVQHPKLGLDRYFTFYRSWQPHAGLTVKYEDLRANPEVEFRRLVDYVGIEASDADIRRALDASGLELTREAQARSSEAFRDKFDEGFVFARSGTSGEGRVHFDAELEALLARKRAAYGFELYAP